LKTGKGETIEEPEQERSDRIMAFRVDPETCIGCGLCTGIAEGIFELTDAGVAVAVNQPAPLQEAEAQEALESCPVAAIHND